MKTLFVNACVRDEESRTLELADVLIDQLLKRNPEAKIESINLIDENIPYLNKKMLNERVALTAKSDFSNKMFHYAQSFASADQIIIAAPYWDLSFPAVLKAYFEQVTVNGIAFRYKENGIPVGLCKADRLFYVTTSGGYIGNMNCGYDYVKALCSMYGIQETRCITAEGLDIIGNDVGAILKDAKAKIPEIL